MTHDEAKAIIVGHLKDAGYTEQDFSFNEMEPCIQQIMDSHNKNSLWVAIKWLPTNIFIRTRVEFIKALTWLIKLATPR